MKARLKLESEVGVGTTVTLIIELEDIDPMVGERSSSAERASPLNRRRVMSFALTPRREGRSNSLSREGSLSTMQISAIQVPEA